MGGYLGEVVVRGGQRSAHARPRITALGTGTLAVLLTGQLAAAGATQSYAFALVGAVIVGLVIATFRMWSGCSADVRAAAGGLTGLVLAGQVLVSSVGGPAARGPQWDLAAVAVVMVAASVLVLVITDIFAPPASARRGPPYAL